MKWFLVLMSVLTLSFAVPVQSTVEAHGSFGPLHRYLYATAPYPELQDDIIQCESNWDIYAYNSSGASGLAQFMPSTFYSVSNGNIWNPYDQIDAMNEMINQGRIGEWSCFWIVTYNWSPES